MSEIEPRVDMAPSTKAIVEALLFAAEEPLPASRLASILEETTPGMIDGLVAELNADYARGGRAFHVRAIAGGYRLLTRPEYALWVKLLQHASRPRLSQAALETLSIVAYRQPVARTELEAIRGVNVDGVLKTLVERDLVRIAGRAEGIGRPLLYATTPHFLEYFGLPDLDALPRPEEVEIAAAPEAGSGEPSGGPPVASGAAAPEPADPGKPGGPDEAS